MAATYYLARPTTIICRAFIIMLAGVIMLTTLIMALEGDGGQAWRAADHQPGPAVFAKQSASITGRQTQQRQRAHASSSDKPNNGLEAHQPDDKTTNEPEWLIWRKPAAATAADDDEPPQDELSRPISGSGWRRPFVGAGGLDAAVDTDPAADSWTEKSEARQLYCGQCLEKCGRPPAGPLVPTSRIESQIWGLKRDDGQTGATHNHQRRRQQTGRDEARIQHEQTDEAKLEAECHCRAVYDSQRNSIKCKNMSKASASSKHNRTTTTMAARRKLEAKAVARSQAAQ
jgi:hypothetical protein